MRTAIFAAGLVTLCFGATAAAITAQEAWKLSIADQNKDYAQTPHAMLKIQDSAYLREGDAVVLQGHAGQPGSWHWNHDTKAKGVVGVSLKGSKLDVTQDGKLLESGRIGNSIMVDKDVDVAGAPTQVGAGVHGWRIFVYNQQNPAARNFRGVSYFPYDPAFRVTAHFAADAKPPPRIFRTSRGTDKQFYHAGDASFTLRGKAVTLPFYSDSNGPAGIKSLTAFFTDRLTGDGAYSAGRYVDIADFGKFPPAKVVIDLNTAYNPNCARSAHFTCPIAIDTIPLAVKAGERDPHIAH
jgi:uncharacterized protein (DUF1684 family)